MHRIVVISSTTVGVPPILLRALHRAVSTRSDFELCAICLPAPPRRQSPAIRILLRLWATIDSCQKDQTEFPRLNLRRWQRVHGVPVLYPKNGNFTTIPKVSELSSEELNQRLRAFGRLRLLLNGTWYWVTALRRTNSDDKEPLAFRTADGVALKPVRLGLLPLSLYGLRAWLNRGKPQRN